MQLQKGIFFDNFAPERFSFILLPELKKVIYSKECKLFLDIVKYKISRGEQTASLECGNNKKEFSKVILEGVLQMKKDRTWSTFEYYNIPINVSEDLVEDAYNYEKVCSEVLKMDNLPKEVVDCLKEDNVKTCPNCGSVMVEAREGYWCCVGCGYDGCLDDPDIVGNNEE